MRLRPHLHGVQRQREEQVACRFPLGHYYSPLPDNRELARPPRREMVWPEQARATPGIDWNEEEQRRLAVSLAKQDRLSFADEESSDPTEYWTRNDQYPALDAWVLEGMLRYLRPRQLIGMASGYSSAVSARVSREFLHESMRF